jgi:lysozyme family protein
MKSYSQEFESAVEFILDNEGGYHNDTRDLGGKTKYGICKRFYPHLNIKKLTKEDAKEIYYRDFWLPLKMDKLKDELLAANILDLGVNLGTHRAAIFFQRSLNYTMGVLLQINRLNSEVSANCKLKEDGIIGEKTISCFYSIGISLENVLRYIYTYEKEDAYLTTSLIILASFEGQAMEYYRHCKTAKHHLKGWLNRLFKIGMKKDV